MKHTECKDCELSNSDCGYHFKMDGVTNYDIASLSACDKYGNCSFFKPKVNPQGDLISREALKKWVDDSISQYGNQYSTDMLNMFGLFKEYIDNAPTVPKLKDGIIEAFNQITDQEFEHSDSFWIVTPKGKKIEFEKKRPQGEWIKHITYFECSCCKNCYDYDYAEDIDPVTDLSFNFCANCGADMRKGSRK